MREDLPGHLKDYLAAAGKRELKNKAHALCTLRIEPHNIVTSWGTADADTARGTCMRDEHAQRMLCLGASVGRTQYQGPPATFR